MFEMFNKLCCLNVACIIDEIMSSIFLFVSLLQRHREQAEIKEANLLPSDLVKKSLKCVKEKPAAQSAPKVAAAWLQETLEGGKQEPTVGPL